MQRNKKRAYSYPFENIIGSNFNSFLFLLYLSWFLHFVYHDLLYIPDDLKNYKYVDCKLEALYGSKSIIWEIVYFNDKYIFVEIKDSIGKEEGEIEVFKFDDFFDRGNCNKEIVILKE